MRMTGEGNTVNVEYRNHKPVPTGEEVAVGSDATLRVGIYETGETVVEGVGLHLQGNKEPEIVCTGATLLAHVNNPSCLEKENSAQYIVSWKNGSYQKIMQRKGKIVQLDYEVPLAQSTCALLARSNPEWKTATHVMIHQCDYEFAGTNTSVIGYAGQEELKATRRTIEDKLPSTVALEPKQVDGKVTVSIPIPMELLLPQKIG